MRTLALRLLAVHAHPDDESSKGAATYAYYVDQGVDVLVVSCTGGERGDVLNEYLEPRVRAERDIAGLRYDEMAAARDVVGFRHLWLGYADSGLPGEGEPLPENSFATIDRGIAAAPLVKIIRDFKPHVLITYDENGGYPHPDHIACHEVSVLAYEAAADPSRYPEAGEPWQISKLYYDRIINSRRIHAVYDEIEQQDPDNPLLEKMREMRTWMADAPYLATTSVPVGRFFEVRDRALKAHASQISPDSAFFFWPNDLQQRAWPTEDFQLVDSKVGPITEETDLFAGIEES